MSTSLGKGLVTVALVFLAGVSVGGAMTEAGLRAPLETARAERERAQQLSAIVAHCANGRGFTIDNRAVSCKFKDSPQIHPNSSQLVDSVGQEGALPRHSPPSKR